MLEISEKQNDIRHTNKISPIQGITLFFSFLNKNKSKVEEICHMILFPAPSTTHNYLEFRTQTLCMMTGHFITGFLTKMSQNV